MKTRRNPEYDLIIGYFGRIPLLLENGYDVSRIAAPNLTFRAYTYVRSLDGLVDAHNSSAAVGIQLQVISRTNAKARYLLEPH